MLTFTEVKNCIKDLGRDGFEDLLKNSSEDIIKAALACDIAPINIVETYQGRFPSDIDFVMDLLIGNGEILYNFPTYIHIDWEATADDIMMDYDKDNGYYFRIF